MKTSYKTDLKNIMSLAWQFVKKNGFTMSEALKSAWANIKLKKQLVKGITKFYFRKVDGTIREAYGTLAEAITPAVNGSSRRHSESVQTYFDTEKGEWRCFKKANLIGLA